MGTSNDHRVPCTAWGLCRMNSAASSHAASRRPQPTQGNIICPLRVFAPPTMGIYNPMEDSSWYMRCILNRTHWARLTLPHKPPRALQLQALDKASTIMPMGHAHKHAFLPHQP